MYTQTRLIEVEPGFTLDVTVTELFNGVRLEVYRNEEFGEDATLFIGDNEVQFAWTDEAATLFAELDTCEPIELLAILSQSHKLLS